MDLTRASHRREPPSPTPLPRYIFNHPHESKQITMEMYYRDMRQAALSEATRSLRFKIDHMLDKFKNRCFCCFGGGGGLAL